MPLLTSAELAAFLAEAFPDFLPGDFTVAEVTAHTLCVRRRIDARHVRPGGTVRGPALMELADTAAYLCVLAPIGRVPLAVTTSMAIHFLRRPRLSDLRAEARALKRGRRLVVIDVTIFTEGEPDPVAQATVTYALPP